MKCRGYWVKENRKWAKANWDTYGFDYDPLTGETETFVWPLEDNTMKILKSQLKKDGIEFNFGWHELE